MYRYKQLIIYSVLLMLPLISCKDNSTGNNMQNQAQLTVKDQGTRDGNMVTIPKITVNDNSWVVIHRSNDAGDGPMVPAIIGKTHLNAGTSSNVMIQLSKSVSNGEKVWAMLHHDTGTEGKYEFTGADSPDQPITNDGQIVTKPFMVNQTDPAVTADDQVNKGGVFAVNVDAAEAGWIVIHRSNDAGDGPMVPDIIAKAKVDAGSNGTVFVPLNDGETVQAGEKLWPMLHYDTGTKGKYEFTGSDSPDQPVVFNGNIVMTNFTVQADQSTMTANDQMVKNNTITVDVTADADGWVVVHRDAGGKPNVPPIIAKTQIQKGMNSGVKISFGDSTVADGEKVWPMVHYDTGVKGEYEFDGAGTPDQPVVVNGNILTKQITLSGAAPKVVTNDQPADSDIAVATANAMQKGFVVIHRNTKDSNGNDAPDVSGIIAQNTIYTGTNTDLTLNLKDGETVQSGEKLWAMLHIDSNDNGTYDFDASDSNPKDPPVTDSNGNIVMVEFTVN